MKTGGSMTRRKLIGTGLAMSAGVIVGGGASLRLARRHGLIPPDSGGLYGPGHTLTYAAQRLLTHGSFAREFSKAQISAHPFANTEPPVTNEYTVLRAGGFTDWQLSVDGMVARPGSLSLAQLKSYPAKSQITQLVCEEGWSFIAEWTGVSLAHVLEVVGAAPEARYVVYFSIDSYWRDSIDMADALHPQTLVTYGMNGADLPPGHGGPLRLRVPRQLGYKSVKYITRLTVTDSLKNHMPEGDYSWYAGV
jgi:DMSO/TMAO reductase YedYZ molybdopterin-dependent catalytic subunit